MKGFIEVTLSGTGERVWFSVKKMKRFGDHEIDGWSIKETGDEIKALIEEAQKEDGVTIQYVPYYPSHPEAVPLPYYPTVPYRPDVYRTVSTCNTKEDS